MIGEYPKQIKIPLEEKYFRSSKKKDKNLEFFPFDNEKKENFNSFEEKKMSEKGLICLWIDNQRKESTDLQINIGQMVHLFRYFSNIDQSIDYSLDCKEGHMKKNSLCVCVCVCVCVRLHRGQKNIFFKKSIFQLQMVEKVFSE